MFFLRFYSNKLSLIIKKITVVVAAAATAVVVIVVVEYSHHIFNCWFPLEIKYQQLSRLF